MAPLLSFVDYYKLSSQFSSFLSFSFLSFFGWLTYLVCFIYNCSNLFLCLCDNSLLWPYSWWLLPVLQLLYSHCSFIVLPHWLSLTLSPGCPTLFNSLTTRPPCDMPLVSLATTCPSLTVLCKKPSCFSPIYCYLSVCTFTVDHHVDIQIMYYLHSFLFFSLIQANIRP